MAVVILGVNTQVDNRTHYPASNDKLPEMFAQLDAKISQMMKAVSSLLNIAPLSSEP